jgi:two-component system phosphate regulon response regulator PhoB
MLECPAASRIAAPYLTLFGPVRSIVYRYETADALGEALASADRELLLAGEADAHGGPAVPGRAPSDVSPPSEAPRSSRRRGPGHALEDGEWVLAIVELGSRATAAAARTTRHGERVALVFEPRDWNKLRALLVPSDDDEPPSTDVSPGTPAKRRTRPPASLVRKFDVDRDSKLLLVDDDLEVSEVLAAMLEAVGLSVEAVHSGEDALDRLAGGSFDLVVLDWTLPGISGLDLCRTLRARWERLPVLFLTANAAPADIVEAFACGADDYVVKPFRAPELGARIFGLLRRARVKG